MTCPRCASATMETRYGRQCAVCGWNSLWRPGATKAPRSAAQVLHNQEWGKKHARMMTEQRRLQVRD